MEFKLKELWIKKFKGVNSSDFHRVIGCDQGRSYNLIVVYGENGSGKTTVAEAIKCLFFPPMDEDYEIKYVVEAFDPSGEIVSEIEVYLEKGIFGSERRYYCKTCDKNGCRHIETLQTLIENFQEVSWRNESSSISLYFYHQFSGKQIDFDFSVLKDVLFRLTGLRNIEKKIELFKQRREALKGFLKEIDNRQERINETLSRIAQYISEKVDVLGDSEGYLKELVYVADCVEVLVKEKVNVPRLEGTISLLVEELLPSYISNVESEQRELRKKTVELQELKEKLEKERRLLNKEKEKILNEIRDCQNKLYLLEEYDATNNEIDAKLRKILQEFWEISSRYNEYKKKKEKLEEEISKLEDDINYLFQKFQEVIDNVPYVGMSKKIIDELNLKDFVIKGESIQVITDRIINKIEAIYLDLLDGWKNTLRQEISDIFHRMDSIKVKKQAYEEERREIEKELEEIKKQEKNVKEIVEKEIMVVKEQIVNKINELKSEEEQLSQRLNDITSKIFDIDRNIEGLESKIKELFDKKREVESLYRLLSAIMESDSVWIKNIVEFAEKTREFNDLTRKKVEDLIEIYNVYIQDLEQLKEKVLKRILLYLSSKVTEYFRLLTDHKKFRRIEITSQGPSLCVKVEDIVAKGSYTLTPEKANILNGQARASLILSLQIASLEMVHSVSEDNFYLLVLDDPTQAYDKKHKKNFCEFIEKVMENSNIQVILLTFDENLVYFDFEQEEPMGFLVERFNIPRLIQNIEYSIEKKGDMIESYESYITSKCVEVSN